MGTGKFGSRHVFRHDQFKYWPAIRSVCHSGAAAWKASFTPRMSSLCSELVLAAAFGVRMGPSKAPGNQVVAWTVQLGCD